MHLYSEIKKYQQIRGCQNSLVLNVVNVTGSLGSLLPDVLFSATTVTLYVVNGLNMSSSVCPTTTLSLEVTTDTMCEP